MNLRPKRKVVRPWKRANLRSYFNWCESVECLPKLSLVMPKRPINTAREGYISIPLRLLELMAWEYVNEH